MSNRNVSPKLKLSSHLKGVSGLVQSAADSAWQAACRIWEFAEPALGEERSSQALAAFLSAHGFTVTWPWKSLPTAFRAEKRTARGKGPIIAHHRTYSALCRLPGARKGMLQAAAMLAAGAVELAINPPLLRLLPQESPLADS